MGSINTNLRIKHFVHNLQHLLKNFHHPFRPSDFFPVQLPIFFNLQQSSLIKNLQQPNPRVHIPNVTHNMKTTKNQSIKGSFGELPSLWEPSSLVVLQISNGMYIYIYLHMDKVGGLIRQRQRDGVDLLGRTSKDPFYRFVSVGVKGARNWNMWAACSAGLTAKICCISQDWFICTTCWQCLWQKRSQTKGQGYELLSHVSIESLAFQTGSAHL